MKPTYDYAATVLDNRHVFTDPFYQRFRLRAAPRPLRLDDRVEKSYLFPTFYGDVTCAIGIFLCSYRRAAELVARELAPSIRPVAMPRGRAVVAFSCYEYRSVMGLPPYNEIAMTIPVLTERGPDLPVLPMIKAAYRGFGYYVFDMPVTSYENQLRGNRIWGLPKVTREIDIREERDRCVTTAREDSGESYFELAVPTTGAPVDFDVTSHLYTRLDGRILRSETNFRARFAVTKHPARLIRKGGRPDEPVLRIGDGPSAEKLRRLDIEGHPFQFRFARGMTSCFDLPDPQYTLG